MIRIFFVIIIFIFISCEPYKVKLSKDTLILNGKSFKYNACMINKLDNGTYSVELSGLTDDDAFFKSSISIKKSLNDSSFKIVDVWFDGSDVGSEFTEADENLEVLNISENVFNIKANFHDINDESNLVYKLEASCNVELSSAYPKVVRDGKKVSSNVACSAYEALDDRMVVVTTINYQNRILILNNVSTTVDNEVAFGDKDTEGGYHFYYGDLEDNSSIRGNTLTLIYYNPLDDKLRYEVECELGKTTRK